MSAIRSSQFSLDMISPDYHRDQPVRPDTDLSDQEFYTAPQRSLRGRRWLFCKLEKASIYDISTALESLMSNCFTQQNKTPSCPTPRLSIFVLRMSHTGARDRLEPSNVSLSHVSQKKVIQKASWRNTQRLWSIVAAKRSSSYRVVSIIEIVFHMVQFAFAHEALR